MDQVNSTAGQLQLHTEDDGSLTERLRVGSSSGYRYVGISTSGTFRDQRLPLVIHGRGFGHGQTQQGTTQDAIYLTAGASGNYTTLTLTVNKVSWGSVAMKFMLLHIIIDIYIE